MFDFLLCLLYGRLALCAKYGKDLCVGFDVRIFAKSAEYVWRFINEVIFADH